MNELIREIIQICDDECSIAKICYYLGANYQVIFCRNIENNIGNEAVVFEYKTTRDEMVDAIIDEGIFDSDRISELLILVDNRYDYASNFLKNYADVDIPPDQFNNSEDS